MRFLITLVAASIVAAAPVSVTAQVADPIIPAGSGFAVDITKPLFEVSGFGFVSSVIRPTAFFGVSDAMSLTVRAPLVYATFDDTEAPSSTTLGNLEVGLSFRDGEGLPRGELSVVLPTAKEFGDDDYATGVGLLSDALHGDRYVSDVFSLNALFTPSRTIEGGMIGWRIGGSGWIPKDEGDAEILARYGAFLSKTSGNARFGLELNGMALISESDLSFNERTMHEIGASVGLVREGPSPELFVRFPIDESWRDVVQANVGIRVIF